MDEMFYQKLCFNKSTIKACLWSYQWCVDDKRRSGDKTCGNSMQALNYCPRYTAGAVEFHLVLIESLFDRVLLVNIWVLPITKESLAGKEVTIAMGDTSDTPVRACFGGVFNAPLLFLHS